MLILPAIDLRGGQCVRLRQGDYAQETVFGADPAAMARRWVEQGATICTSSISTAPGQGRPVNGDSVRAIVGAAGVPCQLGGGLRTRTTSAEALGWGVERVVLGTRALAGSRWCRDDVPPLPGADRPRHRRPRRPGRHRGLARSLRADRPSTWPEQCATWPLAALVYTDISRDGMLEGPNVEATAELAAAGRVPVIASGGVTTLDDVARLARPGCAAASSAGPSTKAGSTWRRHRYRRRKTARQRPARV